MQMLFVFLTILILGLLFLGLVLYSNEIYKIAVLFPVGLIVFALYLGYVGFTTPANINDDFIKGQINIDCTSIIKENYTATDTDLETLLTKELLTYQCINSNSGTTVSISDISVQILSSDNDKNIHINYILTGDNPKSFKSDTKISINEGIKSTGTFIDAIDIQNSKVLKIEFNY